MKQSITTYTIQIHKKGMKSGCFRAAFLTDLHNAVWKEDPAYLPSLIADQKPDLLLCGGDMIIARPEKTADSGLSFMRSILRIGKVYFSLGNHEYRSRIYPETYGTMYQDFVSALEEEGMILLDNDHADISIHDIPLRIYGYSLKREKYRRFRNTVLQKKEIQDKIGSPDPDRISILLAHNPKYYKTYLDWGADITLCGHYHGGLIRFGNHTGLISPGLRPFPSNAYGMFEKNGKKLIVSAGLGEHTAPIRIGNPRELVILEIYVNNRNGGSDGDPCKTRSV